MDLEVLSIAANTDNNRNIENRTHVSKLKNSVCGDEMQIELILKNEKILDFGYQGKSCVYCQASASLLSKISINNHKEKSILVFKTETWPFGFKKPPGEATNR